MSAQAYSVGVSALDVTPPLGTYLAGFASRQTPASAIYSRLQATVTAIDDGGGQGPVILVTIEWLGFYERTAHVRQLICDATGVPTDRILLGASHTHCGPSLRALDLSRHGAVDEAFLQEAFRGLADAASEAIRNCRPSHLRFGTAACGIAGSRRAIDDAGTVQWKPTLDAPHDHTVPYLIAEDEDRRIRHVLFGYACHPTGMGDVPEIGGGYAGFAIEFLARRFDCPVGFLQGCGGDQKAYAPDEEGNFRRLSIDEVRELGVRLGQTVEESIRVQEASCLAGPVRVCRTVIPLKADALSPEVYQRELQSEHDFVRAWAQHYSDKAATGALDPLEVPFEIQCVTFGDSLAMVGMAGETSVEHGLRLSRELGRTFRGVWPVGYTNHIVGYVPVKRQIPEGGYEVLANNQRLMYPGPFSEGTEDQIHSTIHRMLGVDS